MDEQTLTHELTAAVHTEPPLGFDPDEVVTRTARRRRGRRNVLLAGAGVAVVALAATALPLSQPSVEAPVPPAVAPGTPPGDRLWPPDGVQVPQPAEARLKTREPQIVAYLEETLPKVVPGVPHLESSNSGRYGSVQPNSLLGVSVTEQIGDSYVTVEVYVPAAPVKRFTLAQTCTELRKQVNATMACRYAAPGAGHLLMTTEEDSLDREQVMQHMITVSDFRSDGTYVVATAGNAVGTSAAPPLTEAQLTRLATDPGLKL